MGFKPREAMLKHQIDEGLKTSDYLNQSIAKIDNEVINKADRTELDKYQPKGDYVTNTTGDDKYQPKGEYITPDKLDPLVEKTEMTAYVKKDDIPNHLKPINESLSKKADLDRLNNYQPKGEYATTKDMALKLDKTDASNLYQPVGKYATSDENALKLDKTEATSLYQPKGSYLKSGDLDSINKGIAEQSPIIANILDIVQYLKDNTSSSVDVGDPSINVEDYNIYTSKDGIRINVQSSNIDIPMSPIVTEYDLINRNMQVFQLLDIIKNINYDVVRTGELCDKLNLSLSIV